MRKYLFILLLSLCASGLSAQSYRPRMTTAIDMGTYSNFFTYADTRNTTDYTNGFTHRFYDPSTDGYHSQPPARDVFYKLTITNESMQLQIKDYGSSFVYGTRIYILDAAGNELAYGEPYDLSYNTFIYSLQPGTYYIVTEAATNDYSPEDGGVIAIGIEAVAKPTADDFFHPAVLGTFHADFNTSHTINDHMANSYIDDYTCDFKNGSEVDAYVYRRDLVHQFTITKPMDITLDNIGSARIEFMHPSYLRILSSSMDTIPEESSEYGTPYTRKIHYELPPGTYYVYSKFTMETYTDALYVLNITGKEQLVGSLVSKPIDVGSKSANFNYSHTQNTGLFNKNRLSEKPGKEVFFKFELTVPMEITVDNCGSAVSDTYLKILSEDQHQLFANDTYTGTEACANTQHAYIKVPVLLPGTYYVVSDGAQDGNITTSIKGTTIGPMGDRLATAIDAGTHDAGFHFTDTKNTVSAFTDQFTGKPTSDVFYQFKLTHVMDVTVNHCGSALTDTYMSLLDVNGAVIYSNDNYTGEGKCTSTENSLIKVEQMPAGTYYVVSEGNTQNGNITTTIDARSSSGNIHTTQGQPHIISIVPTVETDSLETLDADQLQRNVQYFDHFGNPTVNIALNAAAFGGDLVTLEETDGFFRKSKAWLPIAKTTDGGQYPSPEQIQMDARATALYGSDQRPYSQTVYDGSPLDLVVEQYGPGNEWFSNSRSVKTNRIANFGASGVLACARYAVSGTYAAPTLIKTGFYADNELYVTRTTNEDNQVGYEFKDKTGHVILSRRMNGTVPHDTYYVYNDYGNLGFVLPPLASDALTATNTAWDESATTVKNYVYVYKYDAYNRCVFKKLPGCEPIYSIYDKADRLIYTQDGEHRAKPTPEWIFTIPDVFGRIVLTGKCSNSLNYQANPLEDILAKADYTGGTNAFKGYTVSGVTLVGPVILSVNYYDNYTFQNTNGVSGADYKDYSQTDLDLDSYDKVYVEATGSITLRPGFQVPAGSNFHAVISGNPVTWLPEGGFGTPYPNAKGQLTGTLTAQLEPGGAVSNEYLYSVKYYDNRGRIIQVAEKVTGGTNRLSYKNDFSGNPLFMLESQSVHGLQTDILSACTYDHAGRRLSEKVTVNGTEQASVTHTYDGIGRLAGKKYAKGTWSTAETLDYNLRSWQTKKTGSYFSMRLQYNDILSTNSTRLYGGGISEWTWQHSGGPENMYSLQYDDAERLTGAQQYMANGSNWASTTDHYTENGISYDKNGNILTMQRSAGGSMVDNLTYTYDGNRLSALDESVASPGTADVLVQGGSPQGMYNYNVNGNMVYESRKNLAYDYNFLNLTDMVKQGETVKATYKWSADGTKLSVRDGAGTNGFDYAGSVVYAKNGSGTDVDAIHFDHGVIRKQADGYMVNYFLNDHLGSTRVVVDGNGAVLEKNDYYPFGARHKRNDYLASDNRYKYNGKEEQVVGDVGFLDYGARFYDPVIGRWNLIDPLSEKSRRFSPYVYGNNNPIRFIDPDGMESKDWFVNNVTGTVMYVKGESEVSQQLLDKMNAGTKPSDYERLGADNMFGDKVSDGADKNVLDKAVHIVGNSENFMEDKGYSKAEKLKISESEYVSGGSMGNGERIKTTVYDFDVKSDSKITYVKPGDLNQKKMLDVQGASSSYSSTKRVLYNLTKPYGQDNKQTAFFYGNKSPDGKYVGQAAGFVNRIFKLLKVAF